MFSDLETLDNDEVPEIAEEPIKETIENIDEAPAVFFDLETTGFGKIYHCIFKNLM